MRVDEHVSTNIKNTKSDTTKHIFGKIKTPESANSVHVHSPTHNTTRDKLVWNDHNHDTTVFSTNIHAYTDGHGVLKRVSYMLDMEYKEVDLLCVEVKRSETTDKLPFLQKREIEQTHTHLEVTFRARKHLCIGSYSQIHTHILSKHSMSLFMH